MKNKFKTTIWLDLLTYILLPFVIILGTIEIIRGLLYSTFTTEFFVYFILEVTFLVFYGYTFYNSYKKNKQGYNLLRILMVITAIRAGLDFANTQNANYGNNFFFMFFCYFIVIAIIWIYPNEIYLKNRKDLFCNNYKIKFKEIFSK